MGRKFLSSWFTKEALRSQKAAGMGCGIYQSTPARLRKRKFECCFLDSSGICKKRAGRILCQSAVQRNPNGMRQPFHVLKNFDDLS